MLCVAVGIQGFRQQEEIGMKVLMLNGSAKENGNTFQSRRSANIVFPAPFGPMTHHCSPFLIVQLIGCGKSTP